MSNRVVCIEVGYTTTQICEMDFRTKNPKVYKSVSVPTPRGVFDDGFISEDTQFPQMIRQALSLHKIKAKQAVVTVTSSKIFTREVMIPPVKANQIQPLVIANASEYFPVNLSEHELGHLVLGTDRDGDTAKLKLLVMACPKTLIAGYDKMCEAAGLHLISIDYAGNSIYQVMKNETIEDTEMVIRIDEKSSVATIISGSQLVMQRNVTYGVEGAINAIMNSLAFDEDSYVDALNKIISEECINLNLADMAAPPAPAPVEMPESSEAAEEADAFSRLARLNGIGDDADGYSSPKFASNSSSYIMNDADRQYNEAKKEVTDALAPLVGNIARVLDLYNSKNPERAVKRVVITGMGAQVNGLFKLFANELSIPTVVLNSLRNINIANAAQATNIGIIVTSIGAAIAPIGFINEEKKKTDIMDVNYRTTAILVGILSLVICGALSFFAYTAYLNQVRRHAALLHDEAKYAPAEQVYHEAESLKELSQQIDVAKAMTGNSNDALYEFLEDLETVLPAMAEVTDFTSNTEYCQITLVVLDLEVAAKVFDNMRTFDCAKNVYMNGIEEAEFSFEEYRDYVVQQGYMTGEEFDAANDELAKAAEGEEEDDSESEEGEDKIYQKHFLDENGNMVYVPDKYYKAHFTVEYRNVLDEATENLSNAQEGDT